MKKILIGGVVCVFTLALNAKESARTACAGDSIVVTTLSQGGLESILPDSICLNKSFVQTIYKDNITNCSSSEDAAVKIIGLNNYLNQYIECNLKASGTFQMVEADAGNENILQSINFEVLDASDDEKKSPVIMCLGDSFTELGWWVSALKERLVADRLSPRFVGAMHTMNDWEVRSENQTGGTLGYSFMKKNSTSTYVVEVKGVSKKNMPINWNKYVSYQYDDDVWRIWGYDLDGNGNGKIRLVGNNHYSTLPDAGILVGVKGEGDATISYTNAKRVNKNPFWNPDTDCLDLDYYFKTWNFAKPDILIVQFFWNDGSRVYEHLDNLVSLWRNYLPDIKIIFSIQPFGGKYCYNFDIDSKKFLCLKS